LAFVCADKPIIHRDVKSSNILLTGKFRAKVADFGFSHVGPSTDVGITHVSTQVKGTIGYLDPEYLTTNQLTTKSDVYSFGILLVEIFTGRNPIEFKRPSDERVTFRWVSTKFILCLVYLFDSFINVVGKVGITSGLNRKRRILIQHQIKLGTFCI
jgi:serine/threonine protein kinase